MSTSVFELFTIGVGPSSSHTIGPMRASRAFIAELQSTGFLGSTSRVCVELFGSLALTGIGHGTDRAVICGLEGREPESVDPQVVQDCLVGVQRTQTVKLNGQYEIRFEPTRDLLFLSDETLPRHPNALRCGAFDAKGQQLLERSYYSIGGGFVIDEHGQQLLRGSGLTDPLPYVFTTAAELLEACTKHGMGIAQLMRGNERKLRTDQQIDAQLDAIILAMFDSIGRGLMTPGILPGGLGVRRRAPELFAKLGKGSEELSNKLEALDWLSVYALAVNEENASFGRVVTAPTNGAAGVIPAVLKFYVDHLNGTQEKARDFLLTAGAIALLFKKGASLSAAEMGCQGEIGVAASMAAGAFAAVLGGSPEQIENAAEIAIEHSLGLTCDPVKGLVQIPCIERNALAATKAVSAARLALRSDGTHKVSLDQAIATMKRVGLDMHAKYKETAAGGLAVTVAIPEC